MTKLKMKIAYQPHDRVQIHFTEPTMTKQSFADECDVNNIMARFEKTGVLEHLNTHQGDYADFIGVEDYHTSLNRIHEATEAFMTIPANIRAEFDNDPGKFVAFADDPKNLDRMVELGLANKPLTASPDDAIIPPGTLVPPLPDTPAGDAAPAP